jgi:hypothetical protein
MLFSKEPKFQNLYTLNNISESSYYKNDLEKYESKFTFFNLFKDLYPNSTELIVDIILYVIVVVNILTVLFFTIVKNVEKEIIQTQINNLLETTLIDENTFSGNIFYKEQHKLLMQNLVTKLNSIPINKEEEDNIKKNNDEIFKNSMIFLAIINVVSIFLLFILWKNNNFDILYYLKKNAILGIFVIFTEILFLYFISRNYMYIDKKYILKTLQQKISKK